MTTEIGIEKCHAFINCQMQPPAGVWRGSREEVKRRAVTISRESGSGGHQVAARLAQYLQHEMAEACPWTVFDRNLVEKVLEDHHLPKRIAQFMPEDRISEITDTMDEIFGLHPPTWTLVHETADTILHLAQLGNVILIGRAANIITRNLDYVFHVRLVCSLEKRIQYIANLEHLGLKDAAEFVHREDIGRRRYVKKYFGQDVSDPLLYHMVINTDWVSYEEAARAIGQAVLGPAVPVEMPGAPRHA